MLLRSPWTARYKHTNTLQTLQRDTLTKNHNSVIICVVPNHVTFLHGTDVILWYFYGLFLVILELDRLHGRTKVKPVWNNMTFTPAFWVNDPFNFYRDTASPEQHCHQKTGIITFFCSPRLHLFDQKYSTNSEILLQFKITVFYVNIW